MLVTSFSIISHLIASLNTALGHIVSIYMRMCMVILIHLILKATANIHLKWRLLKLSAASFCYNYLTSISMATNPVNPNQTAPTEAD